MEWWVILLILGAVVFGIWWFFDGRFSGLNASVEKNYEEVMRKLSQLETKVLSFINHGTAITLEELQRLKEFGEEAINGAEKYYRYKYYADRAENIRKNKARGERAIEMYQKALVKYNDMKSKPITQTNYQKTQNNDQHKNESNANSSNTGKTWTNATSNKTTSQPKYYEEEKNKWYSFLNCYSEPKTFEEYDTAFKKERLRQKRKGLDITELNTQYEENKYRFN